MIKEITIRNFKAIKDLTLKLTPFTILIGENSCGKSTVLQALDFLRAITLRDIDEYLRERGWSFNDIQSQFAPEDEPISFVVIMKLNKVKVIWEISIEYDGWTWQIEESITDADTGEVYLSFGIWDRADTPEDFSKFEIKSSTLKILKIASITTVSKPSVLETMRLNMIASENFELLSPSIMRKGSRRGESVSNIGIGGEKIAAFINCMEEDERKRLDEMVSAFAGNQINILTRDDSRQDSVELLIIESWQDSDVLVGSRYISDGMLRIIGLCTILMSQTRYNKFPFYGFTLLDEIEDGINPELAEKLIQSFQNVACESKRQIIVTSHSPIMVNYVDKDNIVYMWREADGTIKAKPLFSTEQMLETLDYLNPGEAWFHYSKEDIIERLADEQGGRK